MRGRAQQYRDFSGGLNTKAGPYGLEENEASVVLNFRPLIRGSLRSRLGDVNQVAASSMASSEVISLSTLKAYTLTSTKPYRAASEVMVVGTANGNLYTISPINHIANLNAAYTANRIWDWVSAPASGGQGPFYGVNGVAANVHYFTAALADGTWTASTGTLPATAKYLCYAGNRMFAAGMSTYGALADAGSAVVFSNLGDPRDWPAANVVQFDPNDGEPITGLGIVGSGLIVFKRSKAWLVYDLDTGANRPLGVGVGCVSHRSIQQMPQGTVFLGETDVWVSDGSSVRSISDNIEPDLRAMNSAGQNATATSTVDGQRYILSSAGGTYEYDFDLKSWWQHAFRGSVLTSIHIANETRFYVGGTSGLDQVLASGYLDAAGIPLERIYRGPYLGFGAGRDRLRGIEVEGLGQYGVGVSADPVAAFSTFMTRAEANAGTALATRSESDFRVFEGVQVALFATGKTPSTGVAIGGYTAANMQIDAYTLYITPRTR
jgi:hypothetical protein